MKPSLNRSILNHNPTKHGGKYSLNIIDPDVIDFSSNISPVGIPGIQSVIKKNLNKIDNYPDIFCSDLLDELEKYTGISKSNLIVGNGAIEIIYNFCNFFLSRKRILIPIPTFGEYEVASRLSNCKITFFKTMNLAHDLDSFIKKIPKNGCVFICNPNNPTGTVLTKQQLSKIILNAKKKSSFVFVDECFIELVPSSDESVLQLVKKHDNLFVLRSLTKSFSLAGIRIGYGVASKKIATILQKTKIPWSVNIIAQEAGIAVLKKSKNHLKKSKSIIKKESVFLRRHISKFHGFECHESFANFILIRIPQDSTKLQADLLEHKILVRDCKSFRGLDSHYIRIAIRSHKENLKLVKALEKII